MSTVVVCGSIAARPGRPGHAWVFLHYLLGFQALGHRVLFVDRLDPECVGRTHTTSTAAACREGRWLSRTMSAVGLQDRWTALLGAGQTLGADRARVLREIRRSACLLNVNGFLQDEELLAAAPRRVYLDIDPGFAQIWEALGLANSLAGHDQFVTVGANVGTPGCRVPTGGRDWVATLPPVVLDLWPAVEGGSAFTTVGSWRGPFGPVSYDGVRYGLRAHEFRRFLTLPGRVRARLEAALDIEPGDERDRDALLASSWKLVDPLRRLASFGSYRRYLQGSMAEISIAKGMYVGTRGGWFSDRSACYLASGKPVLAQDTGIGQALPTGCGLLCFADVQEAAQALEQVQGELPRHRAAARAIAEEHLDARVVLRCLFERLGIE